VEKDSKPKWQKEVETILRKQLQGKELLKQLKIANELIDLAQEVEAPSGDSGQVAALILKRASEDLRPLAAVFAGFQIGVAWEKFQNASRD